MDLLAFACRAVAALQPVPVSTPCRPASARGPACSRRIGGPVTPAGTIPAVPRGSIGDSSLHRSRARKLRLPFPRHAGAANEARGIACAGGHEFLRWYIHSDGSPSSLGLAC